MERVQFNTIMKKIFAIILIVAILLPYFPKMTFAAQVAEPEEVANIITDNVNWKSGNQTEDGTSSQQFAIQYSATFNRITTGFRNVELLFYTDQVQGVNDVLTIDSSVAGVKETGNGYATIHFDSVNMGVSFAGEVNVLFGKANTELDRKLYYKVTGYYTDPEKGDMYFETPVKELNAHIVPDPENLPFNIGLSYGKDYNGFNRTPQINVTTESLGTNEYGTSKGWYTTSLNVVYPLELKAYEKAQQVKLQLTFNRYDYAYNSQTEQNDLKVNQMDLGYSINWGELDDDLGTPQETVNADGSVTYTFIKGTDSNVYVDENTFNLNKKYTIAIGYNTTKSNPEIYGEDATSNSVFDFNAKMTAKGFNIAETYDSNTKQINRTITYQTKSKLLDDTRSKNLYLYTTGDHTWINLQSGAITVGNDDYQSDKIDDNVVQMLRNGDVVEVKTIINATKIGESMQFDSTTGTYTEWENLTGALTITTPRYRTAGEHGYISESTGNRMELVSIRPLDGTTGRTGVGKGGIVKYIEPGEICVNDSSTPFFNYSYSNHTESDRFTVYLEDYLNKEFTGYEITYKIDLSNVDESVKENFLNKILSIQVYFDTANQTYLQGKSNFVIYGPDDNHDRYYSAFSIDSDNTDSLSSSGDKLNKWEHKKVTLKMSKVSGSQGSGYQNVNYNTLNENPTFYVELPDNFSYKNMEVTVGNSLNIKKQLVRKYGNKKYLVIQCNGTYNSKTTSDENIIINFDRKLTNDVSVNNSLYVYMFTDNENYWAKSDNTQELNKDTNGVAPQYTCLGQLFYGIVGSSKKEATTSIEKDNNEYKTDPSNDVDDNGEKQYPLIVATDNRVTFNSRISAEGSTLNNLTILTRLPFANNTQLYKNSNNVNEQLIESTYKIENNAFWDKKGDSINGLTSTDVIPQVSLTDLQIEGVYVLNNGKNINTATPIDKTNYKIYYTTQADADFDSTSYVEYDPEGTNVDFAQAKNIKVVFNEGYTVTSGKSVIVKYSMKMPDAVGMVGTTTAVKYSSNNVEDYLYSPAAYVINGSENINIELQKKFENLPVGTAPAELEDGLAGIQFRLYYFDETTGEKQILKDSSNNEIIATTDANGIAKFLNVPAREYVLEEITTFDNYNSVDGIMLAVESGDTLHASENIVENPIKRATVIITKLWNGQPDGSKRVSLRLARKENPVETINYSTRKYTTNGVITLNQVPYGEYTITEASGVDGWTAEVPVKSIQINSETVNETFNNVPSTATMKIVKTVPSRETVDGLTFKVSGRGKVTYFDENGVEQNTDSETTVKIGDESTYGSNITVEKSNNNRTATITISNLYLGL